MHRSVAVCLYVCTPGLTYLGGKDASKLQLLSTLHLERHIAAAAAVPKVDYAYGRRCRTISNDEVVRSKVPVDEASIVDLTKTALCCAAMLLSRLALAHRAARNTAVYTTVVVSRLLDIVHSRQSEGTHKYTRVISSIQSYRSRAKNLYRVPDSSSNRPSPRKRGIISPAMDPAHPDDGRVYENLQRQRRTQCIHTSSCMRLPRQMIVQISHQCAPIVGCTQLQIHQLCKAEQLCSHGTPKQSLFPVMCCVHASWLAVKNPAHGIQIPV